METLTVEKQINRFKQQFLQLNQAGIEDLLDTNQLHQMVGNQWGQTRLIYGF